MRLTARPLLWAAIAAHAAAFGALSVLRHRAFNTGRFDLGNMVQAVSATAHGHVLRVTDLHGEQISRLGAHFDPILVAFAPFWWLWPSPDLLVVIQAAAVAVGALPVFWLARKHLYDDRAALGFALAYLLYPATQWLVLNEFHPIALACPLLLFAIWYLDEDRLVPFVVLSTVAATTKEEVAFVVAGLGVWYAISRRRWRAGTAIAAAGIGVALVLIQVVIPHFNPLGHSSFAGRYRQVGGSPAGIVRTLLTHPLRVLGAAFEWRDWRYVAELVVPLAGLGLLAPLMLVAAAPELAANVLSRVHPQASIHFHYTAAEIPPLVAASVYGAARLIRRRPNLTATVGVVVVVVALVSNFRFGAIPLWRELPGGSLFQARDSYVSPHDRVADRAVRLVPGGVVVSATNSLGAHLSARRRILSFPLLSDATWVAIDETRASYLDRSDPVRSVRRIVRLRRNPQWRLVFERDGILVFRRLKPEPPA
jgi:uncharacterized membrane protein